MLGLAQFQHDISKNKKIVYSVFLVVMIVFSGLLGCFIHLDDTFVSADAVMYTENFDDDTEGNPPENETWFSFLTNSDGAVWDGIIEVSSNYSVSGDQSFRWKDIDEDNIGKIAFELTESYNFSYINFSVYPVTGHESCCFLFHNESGLHWGGSGNPNLMIDIYMGQTGVGDFNATSILYKNSSDYQELISGESGVNVVFDAWNNISIQTNYTDDTFRCSVNNGSGWRYGDWVNPYDEEYTYSGISSMRINSGTTTQSTHFYLDDLIFYNESSLQGYPTIDSSLFNSSLTQIGNNYYITFDGQQGEKAWCNSSGSDNENMRVYILDGNQSVKWINITLQDVGTSPHIPSEQFYLWASESFASGYVNISGFPPGGGNVTVNSSTWPGEDPFGESGIDGDEDIFFRFLLVIPGDQVNQTYSETTGCKVWIGG